RRDWFGEFVFDPTATAYRYQVALNGYDAEAPGWLAELFATGFKFCHPTKDDGKCRYGVKASKPHPGITRFSAAIDPGTSDRATLQITGWGDETHEVQHVFEWSTPRKAGATWDDIAGVAGFVNGKLDIEAWRYDGGGSNMEIDTFGNDYGLPVIKAAAKADMRGQIARENTLFQKGWSRIMKGSALEEDYQKARLDPDALARGQLKWSSQWHPDPSEAKRYADQGYYDAYQAPEAQLDEGARLAYAARHRNDEEDDDPLGLMDDDD
ncbi:MAG TPA: hypothetical protein VFH73_08725, partial [Polyangia bacterium]|nr:hypothetical protein [Polyangia bacterium]